MAGPYYVRSTDGNDADSGLTWALAKATLEGALAVAAAGERIWVSQAHAGSAAAAKTFASAGTAAAPVEILCGNDAAEPPTALATTATIVTTGARAMTFTGHAYCYGIGFTAGSSSNLASINFNPTTSVRWRLESCALVIGNTNANSRIILGSSSTGVDTAVEWLNTTVQFGAVGQAINPGCPLRWDGGSLVVGTAPTGGLFKTVGGLTPYADLRGVDLSAIGSNALVGWGSGAMGGHIRFLNCKIAAGTTLTTGTNPGPGQTRVWMDNTDSDNTNYRMQRSQYEGDVYSETTLVRTGGASDGTTTLSHKMASTANARFTCPLHSPDIVQWNEVTGSAKTVTVEILHDSATALTDAEVWVDVEYLGTSSLPLSLFASDRAATVLTTPSDQTTSAATWTTTGLSNPNTQKLAVIVTPQVRGGLRARVALAKASKTIYVDPLLTVT